MDNLTGGKRYDAIRKQYARNAVSLAKQRLPDKAATYRRLSTATDAEIAAHLQQAYRAAMARLEDLKRPARPTPCAHEEYYTINAVMDVHRCQSACGHQFTDATREAIAWEGGDR